MMTRYFIDFEFIEDGRTIDPLSIGIVCDDGREYYSQFVKAQFGRANDFVAREVYPSLQHFDMGTRTRSCKGQSNGDNLPKTKCGKDCPWETSYQVSRDLLLFVDPEKYGKPYFWGYYADYDWVALCQLYGTMMDLPEGWPKYCRDLKQWADDLGGIILPKQEGIEHHALYDARWNLEAYNYLAKYELTWKGAATANV